MKLLFIIKDMFIKKYGLRRLIMRTYLSKLND